MDGEVIERITDEDAEGSGPDYDSDLGLREVTGRLATMTELLMLGRDSPSQSESLPMNKNESESLSEPEIDLSDLPETAGWAAEEEDLLQTMTPWQSSTPLIGSELPH